MSLDYPDTHHDVSSNTIFGFWLYLMTDAVMFATFFAAYAVLQGGTAGGPGPREIFNLPLVLFETVVLMSSSFTCGIAGLYLPKSEKGKVLTWLGVTFVLGALFVGLEWADFSHLIQQGLTWKKSAFLSAYFTLIGTHGLHIIVGLMFLAVFAVQLFRQGFSPVLLRRLTCFRIYWQFVYFIWIFTFTLVYLMGGK